MKKFRKVLKWTGIVLLVLMVTAFTLYLIYLRPFMQKMKQTSVIKYDSNLTLVMGGGGNSGILVSDSLVLVIDTKMDDAAKALYEQVKQLAGNKPILVINTHYHPDHVGGNAFYAGQTILAGGTYTKEEWIKNAGEKTLPTGWVKERMDLRLNGDTVTILNLGRNAHTESDVMVYLHKEKMLFAGDVILNKQNPIIMGKGDPEGFLWAFDEVQKQFDIQKVVPGHGELGGPEVVNNFRQYFSDMKTIAADPAKKEELAAKYKDWGKLPFFMSPSATVKAFKKKN